MPKRPPQFRISSENALMPEVTFDAGMVIFDAGSVRVSMAMWSPLAGHWD